MKSIDPTCIVIKPNTRDNTERRDQLRVDVCTAGHSIVIRDKRLEYITTSTIGHWSFRYRWLVVGDYLYYSIIVRFAKVNFDIRTASN